MIKLCINSKEDCNLIFNNCKKIWLSDGSIGGSINFLVDYYAASEDFPVCLKYNATLNKLSFEDAYESTTIKYSFEFNDIKKFIEWVK